jgi:phosphoribosyl-dephospho-CoA transferase
MTSLKSVSHVKNVIDLFWCCTRGREARLCQQPAHADGGVICTTLSIRGGVRKVVEIKSSFDYLFIILIFNILY